MKAAGTTDTDKVVAVMKATPVDDFFSHGGHIRADGRMAHDLYLLQVKAPAEQTYPWDYLKLIRVIPGEEAFRPLAEGGCPLRAGREKIGAPSPLGGAPIPSGLTFPRANRYPLRPEML